MVDLFEHNMNLSEEGSVVVSGACSRTTSNRSTEGLPGWCAVHHRGSRIEATRREDFDIRVGALNSGQDWFELKPEIRWKGKKVSDEVLAAIIAGKSVVSQDGEGHVIDQETMEALRQTVPGDRRSSPGQEEARMVVEVPRLRILDLMALRKHGVVLSLPEEDRRSSAG
jgi:hypothetical protein